MQTAVYKKIPTLFIISPVYNEEEVLPINVPIFLAKLKRLKQENLISKESKFLMVDDGSKDKSWQMIEDFANNDKENIIGIKLAGNRGQQIALLCGLKSSIEYGADCSITIDVDLQDDINTVEQMVANYTNGADIVYGVRSARKKDSFFKKFSAQSFYKIMNKFGAKIIYDHSEYRLMSKRAIEGLLEYKESNLFLRGLVQMEGYPFAIVSYEREERTAGTSKYPLKKLLALAYEGITSLTTTPLKIIKRLGIFNAIIGFLALISLIVIKYTIPFNEINLWLILSGMMAFTGLTITAFSFIGDYVGKIYQETKQRPKYFIDKTTIDE